MTARGGQITLEAGQVAVCVHCHAIAECGYIDTDAKCIECGQGGVIVRDVLARGRKAIAQRWGEDVARTGFTAAPDVLADNLAALGLTPLDFLLLHCIERRRRERPEAWEEEETLAKRARVTTRHARRRLERMRAAGLIEWTRERKHGGQWAHRVYTRHGLTEVCALLAANRRADRCELAGVPELLAELRQRTSVSGGTTGPQRPVAEPTPPPDLEVPHHRTPMSTTTGPGGPTKQRPKSRDHEADSPSGASLALSRDDGAHDDLDEDAFAWDDPTEVAEAGEEW